jgi:hypothetical protein
VSRDTERRGVSAEFVETEDEPRVRVSLLRRLGVRAPFFVLYGASDEFAPASGRASALRRFPSETHRS